MKIVLIQIKGGNYGGVWQVNKIVGESLIKKGYDVSVVSIRDDHDGIKPEHDERLKLVTINEKDIWHTYHGEDFKECIQKHQYWSLIKQLCHRLRNEFRLKNDARKLKKYLDNENPDYLVLSHYQLLKMLPKSYLLKTYCEQHTSFRETKNNPDNMKVFYKYNDLIKGYIWLTKKTMEDAIKAGLTNSVYIYNAVRFETLKKADVVKNKKIIVVSRLSTLKRIDKMVEIVEEVFKEKKYYDWVFEIYGDGEEYDNIKKLIQSPQVKLMGRCSDSKKIFLSASINLCTSDFEGFSLSILEANECGIPTISFDFGESAKEEIIDSKTGFIASDKNDFINKLRLLMDNSSLLQKMSQNVKDYNRNFHMDKIILDWEKIFTEKK